LGPREVADTRLLRRNKGCDGLPKSADFMGLVRVLTRPPNGNEIHVQPQGQRLTYSAKAKAMAHMSFADMWEQGPIPRG